MRDIKFRAWDKEFEKMTYFDDEEYDYRPPLAFRLDQVFKKDINYNDYEDFEYKDITDKLEIMQFTGLHDKNGKEIYEGDIIQYEDITKGLVRYSEKYAQYVLVNTGSVKDEFEPLGDYNMEVFEIIGNEYDNPDLLEKGAEE